MSGIFEELAEKRAVQAAEEKRLETLTESIKSLMDTVNFSFEQAIQALCVSEEDMVIISSRITN